VRHSDGEMVVLDHRSGADTLADDERRWLRLLIGVNRAAVGSEDEQALAGSVCALVVESGLAASCAVIRAADGVARPLAIVGPALAVDGARWAALTGPGGAVARALAGQPGDDAASDGAIVRAPRAGGAPSAFAALVLDGAAPLDDGSRALLRELVDDLAAAFAGLPPAPAQGVDHRQLVLLRHALDASLDPVYVIHRGAAFTYVNHAAADLLGYSRAELMGGMSVADIDPSFAPEGHAERWRDRRTPYEVRFETRHRTRDGRLIPVEVYATRFTSDGAVQNIAIARDLRERKAAEARLREQELRYRSVVTALREGVLVHGADGALLTVNPAAERLLGYSAAELTGGPLDASRVDPRCEDGRPLAADELPPYRTLRTGAAETDVVLRLRRRDGRCIWVSVNTRPLIEPGADRPHAVVSTLRDVTDEREALAALRARERDYRILAESIPALMVRWDRSLSRVYVNRAFAEAVGNAADPGKLLGGRAGSSYGPTPVPLTRAVIERLQRSIEQVFATGQPEELETLWPTASGSRTHLLRLVPERDEHGEVVTVLGVSLDVSALKQTERQLRSLAEHSPDLVLRFDGDARYLFVNSAMERLTGHPAAAFLGRAIGDGVEPGPPGALGPMYARLKSAVRAVWDTGEPVEYEAVFALPQGDRVLEWRLFPERDEGGLVSVLALVRDVTERRRAQAALRASERRLVEVTEHIDEVFRLSDVATGQVVYLSPAYRRMFRRSPDDVLADPSAWLAPVCADHYRRVADALDRQAEGYEVEYQIGTADGVRWIQERGFPIRDEQGVVVRVAAVAQDVTLRRRLEHELRQALKLEAVGRLAGGIAHDFNNMLAVVQMEGTLLLDEPLRPEVREPLLTILATAERAANLTRQLLTFSRRQVPRFEAIDLGGVVTGLSTLLRRTLPENIDFETRLDLRVPAVRADVGMIEQVLMNLVLNARDAMPDGGQLTVDVGAVSVGRERLAARPEQPAGEFVRMRVSDTGTGIPADVLPHIFEPFFTTKDVGRGTGLGLATAFSVVEQHGGWLEVDSALGAGSCFAAYLPTSVVERTTPATVAPAHAPRGTETVLLVEDDPAVRAASRAVLGRFGYRVIEADSAAAALVAWEQAGPDVDLLVTDLVMPGGLSGRHLADELARQAPGLRVLYTSGYSPDVVARMLPLDEGRAFLQKPCTAQQLALAVRASLDDRRSATPAPDR